MMGYAEAQKYTFGMMFVLSISTALHITFVLIFVKWLDMGF